MTDLIYFVLLPKARDLLRKEEGQGLVEYALILALVVVVAIGVLELLGGEVIEKLQEVVDGLSGDDAPAE